MMTFDMPGTSYHGDLPPLSADQQRIKHHLEAHIAMLAEAPMLLRVLP